MEKKRIVGISGRLCYKAPDPAAFLKGTAAHWRAHPGANEDFTPKYSRRKRGRFSVRSAAWYYYISTVSKIIV